MLIPDNLRQEHMPLMVYAVCKLIAKGDYSEDEVIKIVSVTEKEKDEKSSTQAASVVNFVKNAGIAHVEKGKLVTEFSEDEVLTAKNFSLALLKKIDLETSDKFSKMLQWFLWKGSSIESLENHREIRKEMLEDSMLKQLNVSEDLVHGFLFWIEFLRIATPSIPMGEYNYSIDNILIDYFKENQKELSSYGNMPTLELIKRMEQDLFFIKICYSNTTICDALSFALRVVEMMGIIQLEDKNDGSMTWHLQKSNAFRTGNSFTNIRVV